MNTKRPRGVYKLLLVSCIAMSYTSPTKANPDYDFLRVHPVQSSIFLKEKLTKLVQSNSHSREYVEMYTVTGKTHTAALLGRALYYFPIFERHLSDQHMPLELKYLSMVESELRTDVESGSGAVGLWQFMPSTAKHYGLRIESWLDERRDPESATAAAVIYLKDLYTEFGNWELVVGAYNCGSGRMRRAVRKAGSNDFAQVARHLPEQTQEYLAKFYAAAYVSFHFQDFNIAPHLPLALSGGTKRIEVSEIHSFQELSRICKLSITKIKRLNPQYLDGVWPEGNQEISILLTEDAALRYLSHFNRIPQRIDVLPEEALADDGYLPVTQPYRILNSLLIDLGGRTSTPERTQGKRGYYSKYFLKEEA